MSKTEAEKWNDERYMELADDLAWQLTFAHGEMDWEHFQETVAEAREIHEQITMWEMITEFNSRQENTNE